MQQPIKTPSKNWKHDAMRKAQIISDAFEVFKAWLAHFANWILFFCLIGNILQTVVTLGSEISGTLLCIQCVMLDVAGASLYTMAQHAKSEGNEKGAHLAMTMSIILLVIMTVTALNGTLSSMFPGLAWLVQDTNYVLIFARIVIVVAYGNIVHQLNTSTEMHDNRIEELEAELLAKTEELESVTVNFKSQLNALQQRLNTRDQEVSNLTVQLENGQREVSNLRAQVSNLTAELENGQQTVSNLRVQSENGQREVSNLRKQVSNLTVQLQTAQMEVSNLTVQLETKNHQLTSLKETMDSGIKWHESNTESLVSSAQSQLDREREKVSSLQEDLSNLTVQSQNEVSNLKKRLENGQHEVSILQSEVSNLRVQLENGQQTVSNLRVQSENGQSEVSNLRKQVSNLTVQLEAEKQKAFNLQQQLESLQHEEEEEQVIHLDTNRMRRSRADAEEKAMIEAIRNLLQTEPELSARAIAARVGCSPTTASKWKELIERKEA